MQSKSKSAAMAGRLQMPLVGSFRVVFLVAMVIGISLICCVIYVQTREIDQEVVVRATIDARRHELHALNDALNEHDDEPFYDAVTQYVINTTPPDVKVVYIDVYMKTLNEHVAYVEKRIAVNDICGAIVVDRLVAEYRLVARRVFIDQVARMAYSTYWRAEYPFKLSLIEDDAAIAAQMRK